VKRYILRVDRRWEDDLFHTDGEDVFQAEGVWIDSELFCTGVSKSALPPSPKL